MSVDTGLTQPLHHEAARVERHFALGGFTAEQDCHLAELFRIETAHFTPSFCARRPGTPPIEPAPIVITTSPSRTSVVSASGTSSTVSTNTGSVLPATRIARARARPSAATIGASPAE